MADVTPGWKHVAIGLEGDKVSLNGLNPWQLEWHSLEEPQITVAHPSYPHQRHPMWVYELRRDGKAVKFAAGEFSNGVWGSMCPRSTCDREAPNSALLSDASISPLRARCGAAKRER